MAMQDYVSRIELFKSLYRAEYTEEYDEENVGTFNDSYYNDAYKKRFNTRIIEFYRIPKLKKIEKEIRIPKKYLDAFIRTLILEDTADYSKISITNDIECRQMDEVLKSYVQYNYDESQINRMYEQMEFPTQKAENCKIREREIAKYEAIIKDLKKQNKHDRQHLQFISASPIIKSAEKFQLDLDRTGERQEAGINQIRKILKTIELYELVVKYANAHFTKSNATVVITDAVKLYIEETDSYIERASSNFDWEKAKVFTLYLEEEKQLLSILKKNPKHIFAELAKTLYEQAQLLIISYYTNNMIADNIPLNCLIIINDNIRLLRKLLEFMR